MESKIKDSRIKAIVVTIKNRITNKMEDVLMLSDKTLRDAETYKIICEQNYIFSFDEMRKLHNANF